MSRNKSKTKAKTKVSRRNKTRRHNKKTRRTMKGGSMILPLRSVIPFNNYDAGDPQRDTVSTRNI